MDNPLLEVRRDLPFDRIRPEHLEPAIDALLASARAAIEAIAVAEPPLTYEATLGALDRATERLEFASGVAGHLESVATSPELRAAYNLIVPKVSAFFSSLPLNEGLYRVITAFAKTDEAKRLEGAHKRHLEKTLDEFRREGAELGPADKKKLEAIDVELTQLTTKYGQNVLDSTNAFEIVVPTEDQLAGLPPSAIEAARQSAAERGREGYRLTLQAPSVIPALTYLDDASLREKLWRANTERATSGEHDNVTLITRILELRRERARLLGFESFSDLTLSDRMAKTGERAQRFVDELVDKTVQHFAREREQLLAFVRSEHPRRGTLAPWDVGYYAEKHRRALLDFDEEALRPYFPLDSVLRGVFDTARRLYGVTIEPSPESSVWHPSVEAYRLLDRDGRHLATFYADLFPRESKVGGAWMNNLVTGIPPAPHVALICANFTPPVGDKPSLLRHREVETLFHEFGHLMHQCLSEVPVRRLAGAQVAWDFVELPSQIMENWTWEREALDVFARHYETGERIPDEMFERLLSTRTFRTASTQMQQLGYAAVDLALHRSWSPEADPMALARQIQQAFSVAELPPTYAQIASFGHLFASPIGYAAGYYSYKWAEVLDADAFSRFRREGIFNPAVGAAFRAAVLAKGDSADPMELYLAFMGREPRLEPLLERQGLTG